MFPRARISEALVQVLLLALISFSTGSAETKKKSTIREILLSSKSVGEDRKEAAPISWHFDKNGSFEAVALTGLPSWSARGTWKETPESQILLDGITDHVTDTRQKGLTFRRVIVGVEVVERREDRIWVRFSYANQESEKGDKK